MAYYFCGDLIVVSSISYVKKFEKPDLEENSTQHVSENKEREYGLEIVFNNGASEQYVFDTKNEREKSMDKLINLIDEQMDVNKRWP